MRILIVCSGNAPAFDVKKHQAFVYDQVEALKQLDVTLEFDYFFIKGKGLAGYLFCLNKLVNQLKSQVYDCIHAHVALAGLLANLQRQVPVVTTFHGSDINLPLSRLLSVFTDTLSYKTIYISHRLMQKAIVAHKAKRTVIPCGVDFELFIPQEKQQSRERLGLLSDKTYILFSAGFDVAVKNYSLARSAVDLLENESVELLELKDYTREEVALLFSAVDAALMTSLSEGSPQFIKEALACNCPVVSTDVGDVRSTMGNIAGCYITSYDPGDVATKLRRVLMNPSRVTSREQIRQFDNRLIARKIRDVYYQLA